MGKILCIAVVLLGMMGCQRHHSVNKIENDSWVTIIFTDAPDQSKSILRGSTYFPEETVNYINSDTLNVRYIPRSMGNDTLSIPTFGGYAELWHKFNGGDNVMWLLQGGDTVSITYNTYGRPYLKSLLSEERTRLYNLAWTDRRAIHTETAHSLQYLVNDSFLKYIHQRFCNNREELRNTSFAKAYFDIDSLQIMYSSYQETLSATIDSLAQTDAIPAIYIKWNKLHYLEEKPLLQDILANDSLLTYPSNVRTLYAYHNSGKSTQQFDAVASDTTLSHIARINLLRNAINNIQHSDYWMALPDKTIEKYTDRYIALTEDSTMMVMEINNPNVSHVNGYTYDMVLLGLDGKQYDLADIIAQFKGKVIYVDLWASWCAPCKSGMPSALKLREQYKDKDIVFLYLAVKDRESAWRKEVKNSHTDYLGENYMVLNADESVFLKEINHNLIPRHLIFDSQGFLVDTNAPRATDESIYTLLDKYLEE